MLAYTVIIKISEESYGYEKFYGSNDRSIAWDEAIQRFGGSVTLIVPGFNEPYFKCTR